MPEADFNKDLNLPSGGGKYIKLKAKGDKVKFRIARTPHYETKHWLSRNEVVLCNKYNTEDKEAVCEHCDEYGKILDLIAIEKDEEKRKSHEAIARQIAPVTTFYYPILDMETGLAAVFQFTAKGIHYTIAGYAKEGVDIFACTWKVERTEDPGKYYEIQRLDEKPLSKELKEQMELAKKLKTHGARSSSVVSKEKAFDKEMEELDEQE